MKKAAVILKEVMQSSSNAGPRRGVGAEDHFASILGRSQGSNPARDQPFLASSTFAGRKNGYVFRNGSCGVGYYLDDTVFAGRGGLILECVLHFSLHRYLDNNL